MQLDLSLQSFPGNQQGILFRKQSFHSDNIRGELEINQLFRRNSQCSRAVTKIVKSTAN